MIRKSVESHVREELIDISGIVEDVVRDAAFDEGICIVYTPHTTAALTINENTDPAVRSDLIAILAGIIPRSARYHHQEGNSDAHAKASLIGSSVIVPIESGKPALGTWQGIMFCEFDGPRKRQIFIQLISAVS